MLYICDFISAGLEEKRLLDWAAVFFMNDSNLNTFADYPMYWKVLEQITHDIVYLAIADDNYLTIQE